MTLPSMTAHRHIAPTGPVFAGLAGYRLEAPRWQDHLWVFSATAADGREVARVTLTPCRNGRMEVFDLFVDPPHRGQHLASRLLDQLLAKARALGGSYLWLEAQPDPGEQIDPAALFALYERHGFRKSRSHGPDRQEMIAPL